MGLYYLALHDWILSNEYAPHLQHKRHIIYASNIQKKKGWIDAWKRVIRQTKRKGKKFYKTGDKIRRTIMR